MSLFKVFYAGVVVEDSILLPRCYEKYHNHDNFAKLFQSLLRFQEHSFFLYFSRQRACKGANNKNLGERSVSMDLYRVIFLFLIISKKCLDNLIKTPGKIVPKYISNY